MLIENKTGARWLAVVAIFVAMSACAACFMMIVVLNGTYGGKTVNLRNPFAPPTQVIVAGGNTGSGGATGSTGTSGGTGSNTGTTGGNTGSVTNGNASSGGGSIPNSGSASAYLPALTGYTTANAGSINGAINLLMQTGNLSAQSDNTFSAQSLSGIAATVIISRLDEFIGCYQRVGAVDARVYIKTDLGSILSGEVPPVGAVAVINQSVLRDSLIACAVSPNDPNAFSAQSANQPCGNYGTFGRNGQQFTYLYAGTTTDFCTQVQSHFSSIGG